MLHTILFDLDGTLIDSIELIQRSKTHAFESRGLPAPSDAEWLPGIGTPLRAMFTRYAADDAEVDAFIGAYREYQLANHDRLVRAYDGAAAALAALRERGHAIGIVTSKSVELSERGLAYVGLLPFVHTIVGADSTSRHKPHPEPVHVALDRLGGRADRALFIGDSVHDMHAGNAAGVGTVAALWGPFSRAELATASPRFYLDRLADLPGLVAGLGAPETRPDAPA
ncbi:MAG: HAD family hydrolase [Gemmatimonadaceae bacterium]